MKKKLALFAVSTLAIIAVMAPTAASANAPAQQSKSTSFKSSLCKFIDKQQANSFSRYSQDRYFQNGWLNFLQAAENKSNCPVTENTVQALVNNGNFKTLVAAATAVGLGDTLSNANLTLFAPTDQAFAKLPAGTVEALLADIPTLTSILTYHAVSGTVPSNVAKTLTSAPTVNGATVKISIKQGQLFINNSRVVLTDIKTTNGVIHVIDTVLIPA